MITAVTTRPTAGGSPNGVSRHRAFDRWYRYPAGFSPQALQEAFARIPEGNPLVIDPFAGSGSAGTATSTGGSRFVGIEAHPEIAQLADLKFRRPDKPEQLAEVAQRLVDELVEVKVEDAPDLVRRCFDDRVLTALLGLREAVIGEQRRKWGTHLKWALLGTLRDVASVKVGWPYQRPGVGRLAPHKDPAVRFVQRASWISEDLADADASQGSKVVHGDSRVARSWTKALDGELADGCVTSPPYFNNFDYADATRLELYFWGKARSWSEMCSTVRSGMLVATTQQTRKQLSEQALESLVASEAVKGEVTELVASLRAERERRGRGKEYDRVLAPYLVGLREVLSNLHDHVKPGAPCAWLVGDSAPYGIYVDTPRLIGRLAESVGFELDEDVVVRSRGDKWRTNGTRHQVALAERLVSFRRPP